MSTMNISLPDSLKSFVDEQVSQRGYGTCSEYVRDLIRRDMERRDGQFVQDAILAGYRDLAAGRVFASSGDFKADMAAARAQGNRWLAMTCHHPSRSC